MASEAQINANRRNAKLSTGPQSPEGKAAVRLNALQRTLTSDNAVIGGEDEEAFDELLNTFLQDLQPTSPLETALVHQVVMAQWRLARCRALETGFFNLGLADHKRDLEADYNNLTQEDKLAHVFRRDACPPPSVLDTLGRYEARIERAFYRALHELQRLQTARKANSVEQTQSAPKTKPPNDLQPSSAGGSAPYRKPFQLGPIPERFAGCGAGRQAGNAGGPAGRAASHTSGCGYAALSRPERSPHQKSAASGAPACHDAPSPAPRRECAIVGG